MSDRSARMSIGQLGAPEPQRGEVTIDGARVAYHRWDGDARSSCPPAILLHGLLQSKEGMANLAAHLARRGPVIVPDLRGRGESEHPTDRLDPATMADDVAALIELLGLDRPVVIGRLHGGLVAYHLAARRPDLVRGLVLGDTTPEIDQERAERALAATRALPATFASHDEAIAFYQDRLGLSEARARHDLPHDLVETADGGLRWRHDLDLIARVERAAMPRADWDVLERIGCPTLLLRGQRGEVPAAVAERMRAMLGRCQVQTIFGARHDVFLGPGCEQAFGAIDLFLMRLHGVATVEQRPLPVEPPVDSVESAGVGTTAGAVDLLVRAINSRDTSAVVDAFASDGQIVQYRPEGRIREGGLAAVRAAFDDLFADFPGGTVEASDIVAEGDRVACVLAVREPLGDGDRVLLAPVFLRVRDQRIAELASYGLRVPADKL